MKPRHSKPSAGTLLNTLEAQAAGATPVWVVRWEDPDRSWESLCLSAAECEREYAIRQADHLIHHWGKVGKSDRQTLLAWLDGHLQEANAGSADEFVNPAKEFLKKVADGGNGPVIVRTW